MAFVRVSVKGELATLLNKLPSPFYHSDIYYRETHTEKAGLPKDGQVFSEV